MATQVLNTDSTPALDIANFNYIDRTKYSLVDTAVRGNTRESVFQKIDGNPAYPQQIRVGWYFNPNGDGSQGGVTNVSVKLSTYVQFDLETDVYEPASATIAWSMPGRSGVPDKATLLKMLQNLVSVVLPLDGGAVVDTALDQLEFGVTNGLFAIIDDETP
jgi:hypothetical protein